MAEEGLQLSRELMEDLLATINKHDPEGARDMMLNIQYLVAVAGYLSADYPGPAAERDELLQQLSAFMKHVCDDRADKMQQQQPSQQQAAPDLPKGKSVPTDDPAVGIWKPE
jgi:hypothetical protein